MPVQKPERQNDDGQTGTIGDQPQHHSDGQTEEPTVDHGPAAVYNDLRLRHRKPVLGEQQTAQENEHGGQDEGRQHHGKERPGGDAVIAEEVEILRIAEGGDHSAEVGGAVLENEQQRGVLFLPCDGEDEPAQRKKGQQGSIVGQEHGAEHGDDHQRRAYAPDGGKGVHHPLGKSGKDIQIPQRAHYRQNAEQAGEGLEVIISQICAVGRNEESGRCRRQQGDDQHGVGAAPGSDCVHK